MNYLEEYMKRLMYIFQFDISTVKRESGWNAADPVEKQNRWPICHITRGFYDYKNKYTSGATEYIVPAKLDEKIFKEIQNMSVKAHKALGCSSYSRADFRLDPNGKIYILEVNTAPGMTATSLVQKAAKAIGVSMSEFVKEILFSAS